MTINSRQKGAGGEREVIKLLRPLIERIYRQCDQQPPELERNTLQWHKGGCDILGVPGIALEIKRCETLEVDKWWAQACQQAERVGGGTLPVLMYRKNRQPWRVRMLGLITIIDGFNYACPVTIELPSFMEWLEHYLMAQLNWPPR